MRRSSIDNSQKIRSGNKKKESGKSSNIVGGADACCKDNLTPASSTQSEVKCESEHQFEIMIGITAPPPSFGMKFLFEWAVSESSD